MDDGLVQILKSTYNGSNAVLILVVVDDGLVRWAKDGYKLDDSIVLILVVVDDGLVHGISWCCIEDY